MKLKFGRLILVVVVVLCCFSCKTITINSAKKEKHNASLPNLKNYVTYSLNLKASSTFSVDEITLISNNKSISINKYSFINLKTNAGHTVLKMHKTYEKGSYIFGFKIENDINFNSKEYVLININEKEKNSTTLRIEIKKSETINNK